MAHITFVSLSIPDPEPYDKKHPNRQRENFYYVLNQIVQQLKDNDVTIDLSDSNTIPVGDVVLQEIRDAIKNLQFSTISFGLPGGFTFKISPKTASMQF